jgi:hypothetical protein
MGTAAVTGERDQEWAVRSWLRVSLWLSVSVWVSSCESVWTLVEESL